MKNAFLTALIVVSMLGCSKSSKEPETKIPEKVPYVITLTSKAGTTVQLQVSGAKTMGYIIDKTGVEKIIEYYPVSETKTIIASVPFDEGIEMKIDYHSPASGNIFSEYNKNKVTAVFTTIKK